MQHEQIDARSPARHEDGPVASSNAPPFVATTPAERALAEAAQRRAEGRKGQHARPREIDGRQGPEPVRYGDWENKGIASDF